MQVVLSVVIPLLGLISILGAVYFLFRAVTARGRSGKASYGFGQLEARQSMQVDFARALIAFVVGLVFLAVYAVGLAGGGAAPEPAFVPTLSPTETAVPPVTATSAADAAPTTVGATATVTPVPFPTSQVTVVATATPPPTAVPTNTPEPEPDTAVVTSPVGVYLRAEPSTSAPDVEWLLEGTPLVVLPGEAQADNYSWIFVRSPEGNEGWVATDFIELTP